MRAHGSKWRADVLLGSLIVVVLVATGCGGSDSTTGQSSSIGNATDAAFADEMIEHHRGAVAMAELAQAKSKRRELKQLADKIIDAQNAEIDQLNRIAAELDSAGVEAPKSGGGMSDAAMGMDFDVEQLENTEDFDKLFIDLMIPHHRGAIEMAKALQKDGSNAELQELAAAVIAAQTREIEQLQEWRKRWYGAELPEPSGDESGGSDEQGGHDSMDHDGM